MKNYQIITTADNDYFIIFTSKSVKKIDKPIVGLFSFENAKKYIRSFKLKSYKEYLDFLDKNKGLPLPISPWCAYKDEGFESIADFLGYKVLNKNSIGKRLKHPEYASYEEARKLIAPFKLKDWPDWLKFRSSELRPLNVPSTPERYYKDKGWINMHHFLSAWFCNCHG